MKTENEYQDGNDLIAIFLGGELHGSYYKFPEGVCPPLNSIARDNGIGTSRVMNFHTDWHWLMQPVLKIINHKYTDGDTAYLRTFGMKNEIGNYMVRFNRCPLFEGYTLGETLWDAVIDFR